MAKIEKKKIPNIRALETLVPLKLFEHANVTVHALTRLLNFSVNIECSIQVVYFTTVMACA